MPGLARLITTLHLKPSQIFGQFGGVVDLGGQDLFRSQVSCKTEVGPFQVSVGEIGFLEVGSDELTSYHFGRSHATPRQLGFIEVGVGEVGGE